MKADDSYCSFFHNHHLNWNALNGTQISIVHNSFWIGIKGHKKCESCKILMYEIPRIDESKAKTNFDFD